MNRLVPIVIITLSLSISGTAWAGACEYGLAAFHRGGSRSL